VFWIYLSQGQSLRSLFSTGALTPPPDAGGTMKIFVDGQDATATPDDPGRFKLNVNDKRGDRVRVKVYANQKCSQDR